MAKSFSSGDAKRLLHDIARLQEQVRRAPTKADEFKRNIIQAAEAMKSAELTKALLKLPVEDLNKSKKGLRTSLLRGNGYTSIAHVCNASVWKLVSNTRDKRVFCAGHEKNCCRIRKASAGWRSN